MMVLLILGILVIMVACAAPPQPMGPFSLAAVMWFVGLLVVLYALFVGPGHLIIIG